MKTNSDQEKKKKKCTLSNERKHSLKHWREMNIVEWRSLKRENEEENGGTTKKSEEKETEIIQHQYKLDKKC